jgi:hypothetical protein
VGGGGKVEVGLAVGAGVSVEGGKLASMGSTTRVDVGDDRGVWVGSGGRVMTTGATIGDGEVEGDGDIDAG